MFAAGGMLAELGQAACRCHGTFNGRPFRSMVDADPRIGARLEIFAAGQYTWLPLEHVSTVVMEPPRRLRDLLWAPVIVRPSEQMRELELGEMLMPVLTPGAWRHSDPLVRLGRTTDLEPLAMAHRRPGRPEALADR
jgi:type VI secretion system protein ImpE